MAIHTEADRIAQRIGVVINEEINREGVIGIDILTASLLTAFSCFKLLDQAHGVEVVNSSPKIVEFRKDLALILECISMGYMLGSTNSGEKVN